jgi:hypothetical protein
VLRSLASPQDVRGQVVALCHKADGRYLTSWLASGCYFADQVSRNVLSCFFFRKGDWNS